MTPHVDMTPHVEDFLWSCDTVLSSAGFDAALLPAVQLQTATADHHFQAQQGEGFRGGRTPARLPEGNCIFHTASPSWIMDHLDVS